MERTIKTEATQSSNNCCGQCRFATQLQQLGSITLACQARPPQIVVLPAPGGMTAMSMYPPVEAQSSCGLFEQRLSS